MIRPLFLAHLYYNTDPLFSRIYIHTYNIPYSYIRHERKKNLISIFLRFSSRKRRTSSNSDSNYNWVEMPRQPTIVESPPAAAPVRRPCGHMSDRENCMDECSAAMVLMSLSTPPKNPLPFHCQHNFGNDTFFSLGRYTERLDI